MVALLRPLDMRRCVVRTLADVVEDGLLPGEVRAKLALCNVLELAVLVDAVDCVRRH